MKKDLKPSKLRTYVLKISVIPEKEIEEHKKLGESHSQDLNKLERFSRRNNIRLIGIPEADQENCDTIVSEVLRKIELEDCKLERTHRDGTRIPGKPRHIIAKLTFSKDKVFLMKNARRSLANETYFVVDYLTLKDLKEKRRWKNEVSQLFCTFLGADGEPGMVAYLLFIHLNGVINS
ncbi:hypothetical protein HOLleu_20839 [Holothuria leucospilota]|uniref:Uncharacterized protein n=1 Tax=Holothuria leucospilota TaxID=206669 RepID=A0A9Q1H6E3_HOLLE|nr:hypothetical protein HOLleu_20839 [Holothuria leucospilota]